ncbi:hypothetical protein RB597_004841 [Gaeumannomyces tritici]
MHRALTFLSILTVMARAGAQTAAQERPPSSTPKIQGEQPLGIQSRKSPTRKRDRIQEQPTRKRKQSIDAPQYGSDDPGQKRQRTPHTPPAGSLFNELLIGDDDPDPIAFWAKEQHWPEDLFKPATMERLLMRKKSSSSLSRKRSNSVASTTAASDQKPRAEKSAPYKNAQYSLLLQTKGSYMKMSELGITDASKTLVQDLLNGEQPLPNGTHFDDDIFVDACQNLENTNEARVIQNISRLIVPSAESHALRNKSCKHLIESVNAGWNNSIPLTGTRPQPDYCVGFRREAFTEDQLAKLEPIIGNFLSGDQSFVMATYSMHFPFLTCEVKCCAETLDTADRQNAHSMTLAVRAIVELFRLVKPGENTTYYRHPIRTFDFTELDGKNKWAAYRFTKNVYDTWTPAHFKNICSAIDQLPLGLDFDVPPLPEATTELSRELGSSIQSDAGSPLRPVEQDVQSSNTGRQGPTPDTLYTGPGVTKRRKG